MNVALAGGRALLLSGALVIAGAGPRGQALGVAEHGHVDADLRNDRQRDPVVNPGDLPQQSPLRRVGLGLLLDALVERAQIRLDRLEPPEVEGSGDARSAGRPAPGLQLAAQLPPRQVRHLLRRGGVLDQRLQHRPAGHAEHLADDAGQLDVGALQQLERAVLLGGQRLGQGAPKPDQVTQVADGRWWHEARLDQAVAHQVGGPLGVLDVGPGTVLM